jgi:hypothetical protein
MTAGVVRDDGVRHTLLLEFPRGEPCPLIARAGLIHPNMHRDALILRRIDRRGGAAVIHKGEPSGIAMRQDIHGLSWLACRDVLQ